MYLDFLPRYPFNDPDHSKLFNKIRRGAFTIPEQLSTNSKCLIRCLLRKEPTGRLSCPEIIMHPWLMDQRRGGTTLASAVEATREGMNRGFTGRGARPQILNQQQPLRAAGKPMDTDDQVVPVYNPPTSS
jgi:serine/threonine protein kinase